jgi:hypothetical protein
MFPIIFMLRYGRKCLQFAMCFSCERFSTHKSMRHLSFIELYSGARLAAVAARHPSTSSQIKLKSNLSQVASRTSRKLVHTAMTSRTLSAVHGSNQLHELEWVIVFVHAAGECCAGDCITHVRLRMTIGYEFETKRINCVPCFQLFSCFVMDASVCNSPCVSRASDFQRTSRCVI